MKIIISSIIYQMRVLILFACLEKKEKGNFVAGILNLYKLYNRSFTNYNSWWFFLIIQLWDFSKNFFSQFL